MSLPTQSELKSLVEYDLETGVFFWLGRGIQKWDGRYAGKPAFTSVNSNGYKQGGLNGGRILAHRVAWKYVYGDEPSQIDHINGNRADNRIANLRAVTNAENHRNQAIPKNNRSGAAGVHFHTSTGKWQAQIKVNGKNVYLGLFANFQKAVEARKQAEIDFQFHPNHGRAK